MLMSSQQRAVCRLTGRYHFVTSGLPVIRSERFDNSKESMLQGTLVHGIGLAADAVVFRRGLRNNFLYIVQNFAVAVSAMLF